MRLIHLTSSLKRGGAEAVLCELVERLDTRVFQQQVIYFHDGPHRERLHALGIITHHVQGFICCYDPLFWYRLWKILRHQKPDCLHTLLWSANITGRIMSRLLGLRCVSVWHNNVDQDGFFRNYLDRVTAGYASFHVAVSSGVFASVYQRNIIKPPQAPMIITNGIDTQGVQRKVLQQAVGRLQVGLLPEHYVIGSVGRFEPVKRYDFLLESFAQVYAACPQARLVLIGYGSQEQVLRTKATRLGLAESVMFIVGQEAYGYYPLFDCFVQSSDKEGISLALLEALSCGISAVVTTLEHNHPVITSGVNGRLVPAGDTHALASVLLELSSDRAQRTRLGAAARIDVESSFSINKMVAQYQDVFLQLGYNEGRPHGT